MKKLLLTTKEVAKSLSVDEEIISGLIGSKKLQTIEIKPGVIRIKAKSVKEYIDVQNDLEPEKEHVETKNGKFANPKRFHTIFWLTAIVAFITQIGLIAVQASDKNYTASSLVSRLVFANIGLGVIFFLGMLISKDKKYFQKNIPIIYRRTWSLALIYFLIMILPVLNDVYTYQKPVFDTSNQSPTYIPTPIVTVKPTIKPKVQVTTNTSNTGSQIDCIGPDGKQFKTTMDECKKLNETWGKPVDYMTNCNIAPDCGGGTIRMSYSQCMKPCSGLPIKSNTNSNNTQTNINPPPSNSKKIAVYITSWNTTYYCPPELVDGLKTADVQYKIASGVKSECDNKASTELSNCNSKCINDYYPDKAKMDSCMASCDLSYKNSKDYCALRYKYVQDGFMGALKGCTSFNL